MFRIFNLCFTSNELIILVPWGMSVFFIQKFAFLLRDHKKWSLLSYLVFQNLFFKTFSVPIDKYEDETVQYDKGNFSLNNIGIGLGYIFWGFFLKICIANKIAPMTYVSYGHDVQFTSGLDLFIFCFSIGFFLLITCYSFFQIGYGTALIFGIKLYRNYETPFLLNSFHDFWKRWNLTYFNFSGGKVFHITQNGYVHYIFCIILNSIIWVGFLNQIVFISLMSLMTLMSVFFSKYYDKFVLNAPVYKRYLFKIPVLVSIIFIFGLSFILNTHPKLETVNYDGVGSVGIRSSQIVFLLLSILIFVIFNFIKKRGKLLNLREQMSFGGYASLVFFGLLYLVMFGSF